MHNSKLSFSGFLLALLLGCLIDQSNGECVYVGWQLEEPVCPEGFIEAYHEQKTQFGMQQYVALCCNTEKSLEMGRLEIRQCRTTDCVSNRRAGRNNTCAFLNSVFIDGEQFAPDYEEVIRDTCGNSQVSGVCCPRDTYSALHMTISAAEQFEFPHMAALPGCGATVYNKDFLVTAAHCVVGSVNGRVQNLQTSPIRVRIGTNMGSKEGSENIYNVKKIIVHQNYSLLWNQPEFRKRSNNRIFNDIALLELDQSINFEEHPNIKSLQMAPTDFHPEDYADQVVITGWGTSELLTATQHLQKSNLLIRSDATCFDKKTGNVLGRRHYDIMEHADQLLCIGGIVGESVSNEAGRGDSGGPAICRGSDGYAVFCGVTSFGSEFAEEVCVENQNEIYCKPSVYADVSHFHQWIIDNAGEQDEDTFFKAILYGEVVPEDEYSHQVHVRTDDGKQCGGTLVSDTVVVTAAHCVITDDKKQRPSIKIDFVHDISERATRDKLFRAKNLKFPPEFSRYTNLDSLNNTRAKGRLVIKDFAYKDDIAVIKLKKKVDIDPSKLPQLPKDSKFKPGTAHELAFPLDMNHGGELRKREFNILEQQECKRRLDRFNAINVEAKFDTTKVMCGVEKYSGGSICDRELGGGVMCKGDNGYNVFCGVQTFRLCEMTLPSAFLNVGKYKKMIQSVIDA